MTSCKILNPTKWFSNYKGLRLPNLGRSKHNNTTISTSPKSISTSPCTPKNNSTKEDELVQVFRHFDVDGDGKISALELRSYFGSVGEYISHEDAQAAIDDLDSDGDNLLDLQDFMRLMKKESSQEENEINCKGGYNYDDDLKKAFEMFEMERGSGCITPKSLQRMLCRLGDPKSYEECVAMIKVFDKDGNGVVDFHEFHQMMA